MAGDGNISAAAAQQLPRSNPSNQQPRQQPSDPRHNPMKKSLVDLLCTKMNHPLIPATVLPTAAMTPSSPSPPPSSCVVILEEGKDIPVFWNGEHSVPLVKWGPFSRRDKLPYATIGEFLSTYAAGKYLRKCSLSLQASSTKYINNLQLTDPFSKILDHQASDINSLTLMLSHPTVEDTNDTLGGGGYTKFSLYIREMDKKKVLWNGSTLKSKMIARLTQADMSLTIESCLQNYVAKGYLKESCQVSIVKESSDSWHNIEKEDLSEIPLDNQVKTLFTGNFASIAIQKIAKESTTESPHGGSMEDLSVPPGMRKPAFISPTPSCHWLASTWTEIRQEVNMLISDVEVTIQSRVLTPDLYANISNKKRALETAIRRRSRIVDEVWRCFITLQRVHNDLLNGNDSGFGQDAQSSPSSRLETPRPSMYSVVASGGSYSVTGFQGDVPLPIEAFPQEARSCLEMLSTTLIRCGVELDIYDEESQSVSRIAGVGLGLAFLVAICTVVCCR